MADQETNWILKLIDEITSPVNEVTGAVKKMETSIESVDKQVTKLGVDSAKSFEKSNASLKQLAVNAGADAITNLGQPLLDGAVGAYALDSSLKELSAITGVTDEALSQIKVNARETAVEFGSKAQDNIRSYTLLLSKLSPEIAKNPEALDQMGNSVAMLAETMHGDLTGATNAASSVMNQFGVDLSDPVEAANQMDIMLNNITASAKVGNQEVDQVAVAIDNVGAVAKNANVSFIETNAALQVLGKYGKEGAEGGIALRNVLATMGKKEFLPKEVREQLKGAGVDIDVLSDKNRTLAERLTELKKLGSNDALLGAMFGTENTVAITGLLGNVELLKTYTTQITEDQTALADMAATMGTSYQEQKDRIVSYFDDIKLSIYGATGSMLPFIDIGLQGIMGIINLAPGLVALSSLYTMLKEATYLQTAAQWLLNIAMDANPIGLVILAISALVAVVATIITYYEDWGAALSIVIGPLGWIINLVQSFVRHWDSITAAFEKGGIVGGIKRIGLVLLDALLYPVQQLLGLLAKIPGLGGLAGTGGKWIAEMRHNLALDEADPKKAKEKEKSKIVGPEGKPAAVPATPIVSPSSIGADKSGANSTGGKIINMTLNVYNTYKVAKEDLMNFEKITEHVVGRINDTMKDALIAAG
ncbi:phage tail tape measure protein [Flavobacterium sp. IMCC34518]|uniref:phage tail tape measure protein n=1 Tax=Flavobacterium sp. IMCC34518 TaxID=3003623 RepID=UPI0022AC4585|nr:phage tail tape measure protein [Flavobacterium sp. IMCC34518]